MGPLVADTKYFTKLANVSRWLIFYIVLSSKKGIKFSDSVSSITSMYRMQFSTSRPMSFFKKGVNTGSVDNEELPSLIY